MNIYDEIVKALKARGVKVALNKNSEFKNIGIDSLDLMDMVVTLEDQLSIHIPDDKLLAIKTIGDLLEIIEELKGK